VTEIALPFGEVASVEAGLRDLTGIAAVDLDWLPFDGLDRRSRSMISSGSSGTDTVFSRCQNHPLRCGTGSSVGSSKIGAAV
jgi:hypothetical protein